jgi:hypothetical protein
VLDSFTRSLAGVLVTDSILGIRSTLESLARETWAKIADGRELGVPMGEVGITDDNMLALRRTHRSLIVHKHSIHEEVRTGADWEWWLDTPEGWLCLAFQAKILDGYAGIDNELYANPKTSMFFADAKKGLAELAASVKTLVA